MLWQVCVKTQTKLSLGLIWLSCKPAVPKSVWRRLLQRFSERGLPWGASVRLPNIWRRDGEALGQIRLSDEVGSEAGVYTTSGRAQWLLQVLGPPS